MMTAVIRFSTHVKGSGPAWASVKVSSAAPTHTLTHTINVINWKEELYLVSKGLESGL